MKILYKNKLQLTSALPTISASKLEKAKSIKEEFYNAKSKRITLRLSCFRLYQ